MQQAGKGPLTCQDHLVLQCTAVQASCSPSYTKTRAAPLRQKRRLPVSRNGLDPAVNLQMRRTERELPAQRGCAQQVPQAGRVAPAARQRAHLGQLARSITRLGQRAHRALRAPLVPLSRQPSARAQPLGWCSHAARPSAGTIAWLAAGAHQQRHRNSGSSTPG